MTNEEISLIEQSIEHNVFIMREALICRNFQKPDLDAIEAAYRASVLKRHDLLFEIDTRTYFLNMPPAPQEASGQ